MRIVNIGISVYYDSSSGRSCDVAHCVVQTTKGELDLVGACRDHESRHRLNELVSEFIQQLRPFVLEGFVAEREHVNVEACKPDFNGK